MLLGALNLTPIEVAQAFQTIASGGNRAPLSALRSVIAEDGTVLYQSYPQAERAVPAQAAYMTLWTMQQVVQRGTGRQLGAKYPGLHLAGKTGTTNNNVDTWFAGIDGSQVTITWWVATITSRPNCTAPAARCRFTSAIWRTRRQRRWC